MLTQLLRVRRSDPNERNTLREVDEWPTLLGRPLANLFKHTPHNLPGGPVVAIITGTNTVGTVRILPLPNRNGAFVVWLIHQGHGEARAPVGGILVRLADDLKDTLLLPHAVFVGNDGRVWRRAYVGTLDAWLTFVSASQSGFKMLR